MGQIRGDHHTRVGLPRRSHSHPLSARPAEHSWYPIILIAAYNAADLCGKSLPAKVRLFGRSALPCCVLVDACFVPLFLLLVQVCRSARVVPRARRVCIHRAAHVGSKPH